MNPHPTRRPARHRLACATALLAAGALLPSLARASDIVLPGSGYDLVISDPLGGTTWLGLSYDSVAESGVRTVPGFAPQTLSVLETQTDLGGGRYSLLFSVSSTGDIYPVAGEPAQINIGGSARGLTLLAPVRVEQAVFNLYHHSELLDTHDFIGAIPSPANWNGYFPEVNSIVGFGDKGGQGIDHITLNMIVSAVPEPGSWGLMALGLAGIATTVQRRAARA